MHVNKLQITILINIHQIYAQQFKLGVSYRGMMMMSSLPEAVADLEEQWPHPVWV